MKFGYSETSLKRQAKRLAREQKLALHEALRRTAVDEGFKSWSLLVAKRRSSELTIFSRLAPGDLLVLAARPGLGKTLLSLTIALEAIACGNRCVFFTLEYTPRDVVDAFRKLGIKDMPAGDCFAVDDSDTICAAHIKTRLCGMATGSLAIIDYMQLLDRDRATPPLNAQLADLKAFARERGLILVFLSQIDRTYDPGLRACPGRGDLRLSEPLETSVFDKWCFLGQEEIRFEDSVQV